MEKYCKNCGRVFKDSDFKLCPYCGNQLSTREGRQPIPSKLRHKVFKRDGYRCVECGASKDETTLEIDHVTPVSKGGTNDIDNLQTLCKACNRAKRARTWVGGETDYETTKNELNSLKKKLEETEIKLKEAITEEDKIELKFKITKLKETIEVVQKRYDELEIEHEKWLQEQKELKRRELLYKRLYVELDEDTIDIIIKYILQDLSNKNNVSKKEIINELISRFDSYDRISFYISKAKCLSKCYENNNEYYTKLEIYEAILDILDFAYYIYNKYKKDILNIDCESKEISFPLDDSIKTITLEEIIDEHHVIRDPPSPFIFEEIKLKDEWNDKLKEFSKDIPPLKYDEFVKFFYKTRYLYESVLMLYVDKPSNNYPEGDGFVTMETLKNRYGGEEIVIGYSILDYDNYNEFYAEIRPNKLYYKCFSNFNWDKLRKEKRKREEEIRKLEEEMRKLEEEEKRRRIKEKEIQKKKRLQKIEERDKRLKEINRTRKCPNCGKEILCRALRCKYCKYSFKKYSNSNNNEKNSDDKKSFIERIFGF